jgi:hypothetical protein
MRGTATLFTSAISMPRTIMKKRRLFLSVSTKEKNFSLLFYGCTASGNSLSRVSRLPVIVRCFERNNFNHYDMMVKMVVRLPIIA